MEVNPFIVELVKLGDGFGSVSMKGLTRQEMYTEFKRLADKTRKRKIFQYFWYSLVFYIFPIFFDL